MSRTETNDSQCMTVIFARVCRWMAISSSPLQT